MNTEITYDQLTKDLVQIANAHLNVASADAGVIENLNYGNIQYPLVFFINRNINFQPNELQYNMSMLTCTFTNENLLQQNKVLSDMNEISKDIIAYLINGDYNLPWSIDENSITSTPFVDNFPDLVSGFQTDFTIRMKFDNTGCLETFDPLKLPNWD